MCLCGDTAPETVTFDIRPLIHPYLHLRFKSDKELSGPGYQGYISCSADFGKIKKISVF